MLVLFFQSLPMGPYHFGSMPSPKNRPALLACAQGLDDQAEITVQPSAYI